MELELRELKRRLVKYETENSDLEEEVSTLQDRIYTLIKTNEALVRAQREFLAKFDRCHKKFVEEMLDDSN